MNPFVRIKTGYSDKASLIRGIPCYDEFEYTPQ